MTIVNYFTRRISTHLLGASEGRSAPVDREGCSVQRRGSRSASAWRWKGCVALIAALAAPVIARGQTNTTPWGLALVVYPGSHTQLFHVTNNAQVARLYYFTAHCTSAATGCSQSTNAATLNSGAGIDVTVTYSTANADGSGRVSLQVQSSSGTPVTNDSGFVTLTVRRSYSTADFTGNPGMQDVGVCAASCFAATYSQSTIPYYSLGAPRSVTLAYNGDRVTPQPWVYVDINVNAGVPQTLARYELRATKNGAAVTFMNGDQVLRFAPPSGGATQQVRLGGRLNLSADATAAEPIALDVTAVYGDSSREDQLYTANVLVANEKASTVARGWKIAGLQQINPQASGGGVLITDGSGSAAYFANDCGSGCYTSPTGDFSKLTSSGTGYVRVYPDSTKAGFNASGQQTDIVDSFGNTTTFEYDGTGRLTKIYDPLRTYNAGANRSYIALTYGTYGLFQIQEPGPDGSPTGGRITSFTVASDSTLRTFKDPDGDSTRFMYDGSYRLSTVIDRRGDSTSYTYDASTGKLAWVDLPTVTLYSGNARPRVQYSAWQATGVPTTSTGTTAAAPVLTSNLQGSSTDPLGHVMTFRPDHWGQPLSVTDPMSRTTTITRNGGFLPSGISYPEGGTDNFTFAGALLTSQTLAGQATANFHYGAYAQMDSAGGTGWASARLSIGPGGRVDWTRIGPDDSLRVYHTYDTRGRVTTDSDQAGHVTRYHYDATFGNLDSVTAPGIRYTKVLFDGYGRDTAQQSNSEPQRRTHYDLMNRVVQAYDTVGATPTTFTYDKLFLIRVQDAKGQVYRFDKNALGWTTRRYDPADTLNRYDSYTYDAGGQLHSWTNRRGQQINYTYDALGRLTSKSGTNTSTDSLSYSSDGKISVMWNSVERDSVITDSTGWVKSVITHVSGQRFETDYKPNSIQQVDSVLISGAGITFAARHYGWNRTLGTLDTMSVNGAVTRLVRGKDMLLPTQTIWPSLTRTEAWTAIHRPYQSTFSVASVDSALSRRYSYDSRFGMQDYITQQGSNWSTRQRTYDGLRRLGAIGNDSYAPASCGLDVASGYICPVATQTTVTFDAVGNRTDAADATYGTGNRVTQFNGYQYSYDLDGNDTSKVNVATNDRKSYEWSADGLLNRVLVNGVEKVRFEYNAGGQLVHRYTNGTLDRTYLWGGGQLIAELNASANQRISEYAYSPGADLPFAIVTGATSISAVRYHLLDEVGNVIGVMNGSSIDERVSYDEWGNATTTGNTDNRLLFKGLLWEPDAGLYYMRARWYDPGPGRFISEDPIGLAGGVNLYAFGADDPVNGFDPSGQCLCWKSFGKALKKFAPALIGFATTVIAGAAGPLPLSAAFYGSVHAFTAAALGSALGAGFESIVGKTSFVDNFARNLDIAGAFLGAGALGSQWWGGGVQAIGRSGVLRGYVQSNRMFGLGGALTLGSGTVFNGTELGEDLSPLPGITPHPWVSYAVHEYGHTIQFLALSGLGINPWRSYIGLGVLGIIGEQSRGHFPMGEAWENLASAWGR